ncbi:hypothetical protein [Marispirochaeta aestuarii]|uniref:hypothetical protein n=1 Tax=Marispirochaeta aestuarii TaxID=1963862 RepID=UPI0029C81771|nr:hypothetical protein [Marispirochaeta aestuarii]
MRISEYFKLQKTQYELDFVDINLDTDIPLFLDPYYLGTCEFPWAFSANRTLENFFTLLLTYLQSEQYEEAQHIFLHLNEPNETRLGLSKGRPHGRGVGPKDSQRIFENMLKSRAIQTGVVEDIEDFRIFVKGIDKDKMSDLTTNVIRKHLIEYTINQCKLWDIQVIQNIPSGFYWDRNEQRWKNEYIEMLVVEDQKVLLVPKRIVSYSDEYTPQKYLRHFVLNFLKDEHLSRNSHLVQVRRNKKGKITKRYVTKKSIINDIGHITKDFLADFTKKHPQVFQNFKNRTKTQVRDLSNNELTTDILNRIIDHLIKSIDETRPGNDDASKYHRLAAGIIELLFYPHLTSPIVEKEIHSGRKRIDITFDNAGDKGFFFRLSNSYQIPSQFIFIECKNYSRDVENPELDQISGRFSPNRGKFGMLLCRSINNYKKFIKSCRDTYADQRGLVIPITDDDLINMLMNYEENGIEYCEDLLMDKFRSVAL